MKDKTRYTAMICAVLVVAFTFFTAQGIARAEALKATPDHFDFGTLNEGDPAKITVEIENTSDTPVEITNVRTS
jgi:hypothetical protein